MIEFLKNWVVNIVVVIFFIAFIEIMLPSNNMKRYINIVLGLLIIIVLINPIIKLLSSDINIEREVLLNIKNYNTFRVDSDSKYVESQNKQIAELYKSKLETEIVELVKTEEKYDVLKVIVSIEENTQSENFGKIKGVEVHLGASNDKSNSKGNVKVDEIENVSINIDKSNISKDSIASSEGFDELIESISSFYRIPKEKIIVIMNT